MISTVRHDAGFRDHDEASGLPPPIVIAAYGESTMTGWGLPPGQDIPTFLQGLLPGITVLNEGVPATTAWQLLTGCDGKHTQPWRLHMQESPASIIVLNRGINEPYNGETPADFKQALQELTMTALHAGKTVVLQTPSPTVTGTPLDHGVEASARIVRELAQELRLPLSDAHRLVRRLLSEGARIPMECTRRRKFTRQWLWTLPKSSRLFWYRIYDADGVRLEPTKYLQQRQDCWSRLRKRAV